MKKFLPVLILLMCITFFAACVKDNPTDNSGNGGGNTDTDKDNTEQDEIVDTSKFTTQSRSYFVMNFTQADLIVSDDFTSDERLTKFNQFADEVEYVLNSLDASLSISIPTSSVYKFNEADAGATVEIDQYAYEVLSLAKQINELTDGYYNPAVYYCVNLYGFNGTYNYPKTTADLPSEAVVAKYRELATHFGDIELSQSDDKYFVTKPQSTVEIDGVTYAMKIDLGGIGKGYAVDKVNELYDSYGFKYGFFNFGSSSILVKKHYKNSVYSLTFTDPRPAVYGATYLQSSVANLCLSTSGDYEQFFELDGVRYCHIIDPTTGKPVQTGVMTATIIGGSAAEDDALTTAVMAMGKERAVAFINEKLSDRKVVFTYDNGESYEIITNLESGEYTVKDDRYTVVSSVVNGKIVLE